VQGQHRDFLIFSVGAGQLGVFAVEDRTVGRVPLLDDLQAFMDLSPQLGVGQIVGDERGPYRAAELFNGLISRVFGSPPGKAAQDLLGLGGPQPQRGGAVAFCEVRAGVIVNPT
jgi:hypothetical protein